VVDATVYSSTAAFGDVVAAGDVYLEKPETAMNLVTIQASHTMDPAAALVGGLDSLFALATVRYPEVAVAGEDPPSNAPAPTTCSSAHAPRVAVC